MKYQLNKTEKKDRKVSLWSAFKKMKSFIKGEKRNLIMALIATIVTSSAALVAPLIIGYTIDNYIQKGNYREVLLTAVLLFIIYFIGLFSSYIQTTRMGGVGRRILFNLRNTVFNKLQELPLVFFNQNKVGDLISRINNDTDQLNQFFSQALMQFMRNFFLIVGAGIFLLVLNPKLGIVALIPAILVFIISRIISGWVKKKNLENLQSLGGMSAEIQENIDNFKVVVAFNRMDYFRKKFDNVNETNFKANFGAGIANNLFTPIYSLASNIGQLLVLVYGIYLISAGQLTIGLLIGFMLYTTSFYGPLQQLASVWSSLQQALAGLDRISEILVLKSNLEVLDLTKEDKQKGIPSGNLPTKNESLIIEFKNVSFGYPDGGSVLSNINLKFDKGKTYALVGPTGGGKTTTASLMARLFDPTEGTIFLDGIDIRSYQPADRVKKIGFILQEPFLFSGTVKDNIIYGNDNYANYSNEMLRDELEKAGLSKLLARFENGLDSKVTTSGDGISLGQKQLIAFIRAILHKPEILILDEATANIDTVTEQLLEEILMKLPSETTKVIIAHRLNTIDRADEICFVNSGTITVAGSMEHAVKMLMHGGHN
ncbi:MAG: ABC transporter ATP-binding protein [bacterium]